MNEILAYLTKATRDEDEMIMRWENGEFTDEEKTRAELFRNETRRPINYRAYGACRKF